MANDLLIEAIAPADEFRTAYDQLKPTERAFVDAYIVSDDATGAALAAFPVLTEGAHVGGKGLHAAGVRALDFMRRPLIQAAIAEKMSAATKRWELTADRVLSEIAKIAYSNIDDYLDRSTGEPIFDFTDTHVDRDQMAAVGELTVETYMEGRGEDAREVKRVKFKLHDKLGALEKAMKRLGLYAPEQLQITDGRSNSPTNIPTTATQEQAADLYAASLRADE